jgi:D-alanyl-D-alanine carboxypeptidase/D-alanyl-D-alanine-endopeptidase (penicillin-binding protein 4)
MATRRGSWQAAPKKSRALNLTIAASVATVIVAGGVVTGILPSPLSALSATSSTSCAAPDLIGGWSVGTLHFEARDVASDRVLLSTRAADPAPTGSTMKVLTMAAAVAALGPDTTIPTRVVEGSTPDTVILIGGGDPTLSRLPTGRSSVYPGAAHLDALAHQVLANRAQDPALAGIPIRHLEVDSSLFGGPAQLPSWSASARTSGSVSNITALQVDGDRDDPTKAYSLRGTGAVDRAASAFAPLLGGDVVPDPALVTAPAGAHSLGVVHSASIATLARYTLTQSDDTLAEALARLVAIKEGAGNQFSSIQVGTTRALAAYGIPTDGLRLLDGSGLSSDDGVTADYLTRLMVEIAGKQHGLGVVFDGLAIAGKTGTLNENGRFTKHNAEVAGRIRGKTGTLDGMAGLTGIADARDGSRIAFTIWAEGTPPGSSDASARTSIDALATAVYRCGASLGS